MAHISYGRTDKRPHKYEGLRIELFKGYGFLLQPKLGAGC